MHIAYITSEFVTEKSSGGLGTYLRNISQIMSAHGHTVTIITLSEQNGRLDLCDHIKVIQVKKRKCRSGENTLEDNFSRLVNSWNLNKCLKREVKVQKIDVVQAANYQAVGLFRNCRIPTVVRVSSDSALLRKAEKSFFDFSSALNEKKWEDRLELWCVRRADIVFAPSKFCAEIISKRTGAEIKVIESPYQNPNIVLDDKIYSEKLKDKKYLLFNSSLSYLKGTHLGIEAADELLKKYPDLYLVYAGGDYGLSMKNGGTQSVAEILRRQNKKYEGRVIYLGKLKQENLFPVVQHAIACVLPSRVDNLPNSCIEAMAMGKIVIGTYGASFEQLIKNKENGLLIKRDSVKSLIKAVDYLMQLSEEESGEMEKRAKMTVERLAPEKIYSKVINLYDNAIDIFEKKRERVDEKKDSNIDNFGRCVRSCRRNGSNE